jgi:chromosome segregation ATPase
MKNLLLTLLLTITNFLTFAQDYPRIETDSTGKKIVIMTYEQAQKIDNTFELIKLLEKAGAECDNLTLSYVKVIDTLNKQVRLLETDINLYKGQVVDKNKQIDNLQERLSNCETNQSLCDEQISKRNKQIDLLNEEITTLKVKRNVGWGVGIGGVFLGILIIIAGK